VLTTPDKRAAYERALNQGKKRLTVTDRESRGLQNPEDSLKHPEAKKFFRMGMICLARKDWKGAIMNFNFARTFEPAAALIAQKLGEAQAALGKPGGREAPRQDLLTGPLDSPSTTPPLAGGAAGPSTPPRTPKVGTPLGRYLLLDVLGHGPWPACSAPGTPSSVAKWRSRSWA